MSSAVHGPVYELKVSDDYTEIINCKLVQRVTVESRTENRRVSDDVVVWRLPF
jgi:hypothetical protein